MFLDGVRIGVRLPKVLLLFRLAFSTHFDNVRTAIRCRQKGLLTFLLAFSTQPRQRKDNNPTSKGFVDVFGSVLASTRICRHSDPMPKGFVGVFFGVLDSAELRRNTSNQVP